MTMPHNDWCPPLVLLVFIFVSLIHAGLARHHHHLQPQQQQHQHHNHLHSAPESPSIDDDKLTLIDSHPIVDISPSTSFNPYNKHHYGRHVCVSPKKPVKTKQSYCKPTYKKYQQRCNDNQMCNGIKVVYETVYTEVSKTSKYPTYMCCPGWKQISNRSHGCNKPVCPLGCLNGGSCTKPETCVCQKGFSGRACELDVDECKEEKPCDQKCINTFGSFRCECRENFTLHSDGQSCISHSEGPGIEAKEMEFDSLDQRIHNLEVIFEGNKNINVNKQLIEMESNINTINTDLSNIKNKVKDVETYKNEFSLLRNKLMLIEKKTVKIDELAARYERMKKCASLNKICI